MTDKHEHERFWEIIAGMRACMVTTSDGGLIRARPMAPFVDKDARVIQFVTDDDSAKIDEMLLDRELCLSFADTKAMLFASVSGRAEISEDKRLIDKLWGPYCEAFFPDGPDSVSVITVNASRAEYWDNDKGVLKMAYEVTKAYFTDEGPNLGENAKLEL
ncbi:general stress protein 26 [Hoeflea halophila]|uniref:General stress protein 26 n=1 Tax=Hoeflea halophila TaxID=714899 RepID=A0A286IFU2_9HYPH|nr:pyridoxamine 5'-phosphate oxidase family protein [Hoeflea halophila]SOE18998.1 general stress protein 26 [Hoeflea halophila]